MRRDYEFGRAYWDHTVKEVRRGAPIDAWRAYMMRVYQRLILAWLPSSAIGRALKTDLFEEAVTPHSPLRDLGTGTIGVDFSMEVVKAARRGLAGAGAFHLMTADLRRLPLRSGSVMRILAGSSLDHFPDKRDIAIALEELTRVLASSGTLVITFDNPHNPVVWLRNRLPFAWLNRLGLVPYYVGATYDRFEARDQLEVLGLAVTHMTAVAHAPRAPAIWLATLGERLGWPRLGTWLGRVLDAFEILERWPLRYQTGYYLALRAEKRPVVQAPPPQTHSG